MAHGVKAAKPHSARSTRSEQRSADRVREDAFSKVALALAKAEDTIASTMAAAMREQVDYYKQNFSPNDSVLIESLRRFIRFITGELLGEHPPNTGFPSDLGDQRAREGLPLHQMVAASRVTATELWRALNDIVTKDLDLPRAGLLAAMERAAQAQHDYADACVVGHRHRTLLKAVDDAAEQEALIEALFLGVTSPGRSLWEIAEMLRIPPRGPFVVVNINDSERREMTVTSLTVRLRGIDIRSVWRRAPMSYVGLVYVPSPMHREHLLDTLNRWASDGAGVSHEFTDLVEVPTAVHYARTVSARATEREPVVVVSNSPLEVAALVDPDVSRRLATTVLGGLNDLPAEERAGLQRTFMTWTAQRGSIRRTAEALFCHPNTVRYRLQRIEQLTGRSVRAPIELAELCLAFQIIATVAP